MVLEDKCSSLMMAAIYNLIVQPKKEIMRVHICVQKVVNVKGEDKGGKLLTVSQFR